MGAKYEAYIESEADGLDISVLAVVPDETPVQGNPAACSRHERIQGALSSLYGIHGKERLCMRDPRPPWPWEKRAGHG